MTSNEIRERYISFFKKAPRSHREIKPAPLVLENDPTTLFTSSGMQPLVSYLMGEPHPEGVRLVDSQPSLRTTDIEETGDNRHLTLLEMLGNWSLGDYFKSDQLNWFFQFLTDSKEGLGLKPERLYVTVFEGNSDVPKDTESVKIWKDIFESKGIKAEEGRRIFSYSADKNWWSRSGPPDKMPQGEIGGPDSEVFYDFGEKYKFHENSSFRNKKCHPNCNCGRYVEVGNSVFIQYQKKEDGTLVELPQKNVDFGGGLERLTAAASEIPDIFRTDIFSNVLDLIGKKSGNKYEDNVEVFRIIADHIRASVFLADSGVVPSNKEHGYVLRRLVRRSAIKLQQLKRGLDDSDFDEMVDDVYRVFGNTFLDNEKNRRVKSVLRDEVSRFKKTLERGLRELGKIERINAKKAFDLYQTYGFPVEITEELFSERGQKINKEKFKSEFEKHKELSRTASAGRFKGGLADHSGETTKLHTTTHLLHATLRKILGEQVQQKGSNITSERLRFDFSYKRKLTEDEMRAVEDMINAQIKKNLSVSYETRSYKKAIEEGALAFFGEKYGEKVKVYTIGVSKDDFFSKEVCGGPHVARTGEIGRVKIKKQEKIGADLVRIYAFI